MFGFIYVAIDAVGLGRLSLLTVFFSFLFFFVSVILSIVVSARDVSVLSRFGWNAIG